jgi:hypothetical protein
MVTLFKDLYESLPMFGMISQIFNKALLLSTSEKTSIHINLIVRDSFTANLIKFTLIYLNPLTATDETRHKNDFFPWPIRGCHAMARSLLFLLVLYVKY